MPIVKKGEYIDNDLPTAYEGEDEEMIQMYNRRLKELQKLKPNSSKADKLKVLEKIRMEEDKDYYMNLKKPMKKPTSLQSKLSKSKKSKLIKEVQEAIDMVSNIKIPKKTNSKNLSKVIEITELITKTPKIKKINSKKASKEIDELHAAIDKAIKSKKPKTKVMQQAKGYVHKVSDVSPRVQNYVNEYKSIITSGKTQGTITKNINKLKLNVMTNMKPSEVDDANKLIADFKKTLPSTVKAKIVKTKVPKEPSEDADYQKQLKAKIAYIKKNKPSITDPEDLKIIADEMIGKKVRSSKKCLDECLNDLGMSGSGIHKIKGGMINGDEDDEDHSEADDSGEDEEEEYPDVKRIGRKPRVTTSGIAGIGMKFKQALQQESKNKYRLF